MAQPRVLWTVLRVIAGLAMLVVLSYGADWMLRAENVPVGSLYFEGPFKRVAHKQLETAVLDGVRGNFFLVDLTALRQRLETVPWVHRVSVRRQFPNDIAIQFSEQQLAAHWNADAWLNTNGDVVRVTGTDLPAGLPRLAGPDSTAAHVLAAYQEFSGVLQPLGLQLNGLGLTPRRSWRLELAGADAVPLAVVLDHDQPRARLERFARVYGATLAAQAAAIRQIDLRYTNGFAVEWRDRRQAAQMAVAVAPQREG